MLYPSIDPQTGKPMAWGIPQAYGAPGGSTYDQSQGFSPDASASDSQWWGPKLDPAAFDPRQVSSSGANGMGRSIQPESAPSDGKVSKGTGELLARGAPSQPPPGMDDGGQYQPVTQPPAQPATRMEPPSSPSQQAIDATLDRIKNRQAPRMIGDRPEDINPQTGKEKTSAKLGSWGQRLAMAVLAATKLAPAAMQIVHPEYSQQMGQYQLGQKQDEDLLKGQESAANTAALDENRRAQASERLLKSDPNYGRVEVDPVYAQENLPWLLPDQTGRYWVDKGAETNFTKPVKDERPIVAAEGASVIDPVTGKVIFQGTPKPKEVKEEELPLNNVDQLNQALTARYQVLHSGGALPPYFTLPPNATHGDYSRIDKALEATERAVGTKAQQDTANEMRRQTIAALAANRTDKADAETKAGAFKAFTPALDSAERLNVMTKNYEEAVKNHDQQAMLSLLTQHLGMTAGLQKGMRINQAMIAEASKSAPWLQSIAAKFDKDGYLSGLTLTPEQMRQMVALGRERYAQDVQKARNAARYLGSTDDGPDRTPSQSTVNHYMGEAKGDRVRAKQLMIDDGWSIR